MPESWIESANHRHTDFPVANLPYCVFSCSGKSRRIGLAIGDLILDAKVLSESGLIPFPDEFAGTILNPIMAQNEKQRASIRDELFELLEDKPGKLRDNPKLQEAALNSAADVSFHLPVEVGDYTDFFASIHHARNVGAMFRPDNPLLPNYRNMPVAYHGRSSSLFVSGTGIHRPQGQVTPKPNTDVPGFRPTKRLDYELELGAFVGTGNLPGETIPIESAEEHVFGYCLLNDWSARDIQKWEYQPLGPFLGKSFATSISPFVVTRDAIAPFRCPASARSESDPKLLPHLDSENDREKGGIDLQMDVFLQSSIMKEKKLEPIKVSSGNFRLMYWTFAQMITHHASNGCNLRTGDLLGSGTVSGPNRTERGCLLERNWEGETEVNHLVPGATRVELELPTGEQRDFLEDGDEVIFRAHAEKNSLRIGFGECRGIIQENPATPIAAS